jgi:hypothetical protein
VHHTAPLNLAVHYTAPLNNHTNKQLKKVAKL